jgi:drug/metabolite transporter (DMT)-like permease
MKKDWLSWMIFIVLSFIWGSSFILMKIGLNKLTPYQVAAIRIFSSGLIMSPIAFRHFRLVSKDKLSTVFLAGFIGNFIPAFLFCFAEQKIDSSLAGTLNALTPIFVIVAGALFFNSIASANKITGVIIAFTGTSLLFTGKTELHGWTDIGYSFLIIIATILYGFNANMVQAKLKSVSSLSIVSISLFLNGLLALLVLLFSGYFHSSVNNKEFLMSTAAATVLGTIGTAAANIIFYKLLKMSGAVFASMVTYGMPIVSIFWGIVAGENIGWVQVICLVFILFGVYRANRNRKFN